MSTTMSSSISFKVRYGSDLRRFRLPTATLTYPLLLQTLMNAFGVDSKVRVTYKDEEGDEVLIGSTRELQAALIPPPTLLHLTLTTIDKMDESMILVEHVHVSSPTPSTLEATQEPPNNINLDEKQTPTLTSMPPPKLIPTETSTSPDVVEEKHGPISPPSTHDDDEKHGPIEDKPSVTSSAPIDVVEEKTKPSEPVVTPTPTTLVIDVANTEPPQTTPTSTQTLVAASFDLTQSTSWTSPTSDRQLEVGVPLPPTPMSRPITLDIPVATSSLPLSLSSPTVSLPIPVAEPTSSIPAPAPPLTTTPSSSGSWFVDKLKGLFSSEPTVVPSPTPAPAPVPTPASMLLVPTPVVVPSDLVVSVSSSSSSSISVPMSPEDPEEAAIAAALERSQYLNAEEKQQHMEPKEEIMSLREFIEQPENKTQAAIPSLTVTSPSVSIPALSPSASSSPIVSQLLSTLSDAVTPDLHQLITASQLDLDTVFTPLLIHASDFGSTRDALLADVSRIITRHHKHHVEREAAQRVAKLAAEAEEAGRAAAAAAEAFAQEAAQAAQRARMAQQQAQQQQQQQQQPPMIDVLPETPAQTARRVEEELRVRLLALEQMGFSNTALNRRLLQTNNNNLGDCVEWLLTNNAVELGPMSPRNHVGPM